MNIEVVKEIRFAVVMYGGVSLAIYINGVAQELLRMMRVTAVRDNSTQFRLEERELTGIEAIYRDLAFLIADRDLIEDADLLEQYRDWLTKRRSGENPLKIKLNQQKAAGKIAKSARFIVDILSGSSAGGINGVYMAKAIVSGQTIEALENLWNREGDFAKLLNDEESVVDKINDERVELGLEQQEKPLSLLNSERMYLKLLTAFDEMDEKEELPAIPGEKAFIDEVDLFVTLTDYWGVPVPIRLFDQMIHERRHRQNLHFRFRKDEALNEFDERFYPFLAYAARSTSSFPLAFNPMQLEIANTIINRVQNHRAGKGGSLRHKPIPEDIWKHAFKPTTVYADDGRKIEVEWNKRVFVDGGYLDNKPFGYAIDALAQKQSDVLVERKLVFIEPEPDLDDSYKRATQINPPFALENTLAALTEMPRYETIREDLQQVLQRNRLIIRINRIMTEARKDELVSLELSSGSLREIISRHKNLIAGLIKKYGDKSKTIEERTFSWENLDLGEIAQQKGQIAYPYYRLRIAALTDDLARVVTHRAGYDEDSDYFLAVRDLVHMWRRKRFSRGEEHNPTQSEEKLSVPTPMLFLRNFDYNYRLRRLRFILQQADRLLNFDKDLQNELKKTQEIAVKLRNDGKLEIPSEENAGVNRPFKEDEKKALQTRFPLVEIEIYDGENRSADGRIADLTPSEIILKNQGEKLRQTVRSFKKSINEILRELRRNLRQVQPNSTLDPENPNKDLIQALNKQVADAAREISIRDLEFLLGKDQNQTTQFDAGIDLEARRKRAEEFLEDRKEVENDLNKIGQILETIYNGDPHFSVFGRSRRQISKLFSPDSADSDEQRETQRRLNVNETDSLYLAVRAYLRNFYDNFDAYDQIIFPVTYETPIGESAIIDVARISPLDAPSLIDELAEKKLEAEDAADERLSEDKKYQARRKVAGGTFRAFGAFFAEDWRKNDILWGRLDAVERFVSIILNNNLIKETKRLQSERLRKLLGEVRAALIEELHETILEESDLINRAFTKHRQQSPADAVLRRTDFIRQKYRVERNLPKKEVFRTTSRSLTVLQKVFCKEEFGTLNDAKNIALEGLTLMVKPDLTNRDWIDFLRIFRPSNTYILLGILIFLSPILVLMMSVWLSYLFPSNWSAVAALAAIIVLIYGGVVWLGFNIISKNWVKLKEFINNMIYSKVNGDK